MKGKFYYFWFTDEGTDSAELSDSSRSRPAVEVDGLETEAARTDICRAQTDGQNPTFRNSSEGAGEKGSRAGAGPS